MLARFRSRIFRPPECGVSGAVRRARVAILAPRLRLDNRRAACQRAERSGRLAIGNS